MRLVPSTFILALVVHLAGGFAVEDVRTVAVLYFDNNTGDKKYDHLGKAISDMITSDLSAISSIKLVERSRLQEIINEQNLQRTDYFASTTAVRMGNLIGAEYVVMGSIASVEPTTLLNARIVSVESSEIVKTAEAKGKKNSFYQVHEKLVDNLIDGLEIALSPEQREELRRQQELNRITDFQAVVAYSNALDSFDREDYVSALEQMSIVMKRSPGSNMAKLTYDEMNKRATMRGKQKARDKANQILRGIFN